MRRASAGNDYGWEAITKYLMRCSLVTRTLSYPACIPVFSYCIDTQHVAWTHNAIIFFLPRKRKYYELLFYLLNVNPLVLGLRKERRAGDFGGGSNETCTSPTVHGYLQEVGLKAALGMYTEIENGNVQRLKNQSLILDLVKLWEKRGRWAAIYDNHS